MHSLATRAGIRILVLWYSARLSEDEHFLAGTFHHEPHSASVIDRTSTTAKIMSKTKDGLVWNIKGFHTLFTFHKIHFFSFFPSLSLPLIILVCSLEPQAANVCLVSRVKPISVVYVSQSRAEMRMDTHQTAFPPFLSRTASGAMQILHLRQFTLTY